MNRVRTDSFLSKSMLRFAIGKLIQGIAMLLAVSALTFFLLSSAGGDAFDALRENPQVSDETIEQLRAVYGLDRPVVSRYFSWLASFATGDLGESLNFKTPVSSIVVTKLFYTSLLGFVALGIAWTVAIFLSYLAVLKNSRPLDRAIEFLILISASIPRIALSLFVLAFMVWMSTGALSIQAGSLVSFILSALVLAFPLISIFLAQANSELQSAMDEQFVQLARAKGLDERTVIVKHASRAALNPLITLFGLSLGGIISATVIVETILGWPGIGSLVVTAVRSRDVPLVMGIVIVSSLAVWIGNAIAEMLQMVNDRRLRDQDLDLN